MGNGDLLVDNVDDDGVLTAPLNEFGLTCRLGGAGKDRRESDDSGVWGDDPAVTGVRGPLGSRGPFIREYRRVSVIASWRVV
jgi:hypothetical protein